MPAEPPEDELLEVGRDRRPRRLRRAAVWFATGALATVLVNLAIRPDQQPAPRAEPTQQQSRTAADDAVSFVVAMASQSDPLTDYVRSDSARGQCALVPVGHSPQRAIAAKLHEALPRYTVRDVARVLDQYTALCILDIRARNDAGSTLVLEVASPRDGDRRKPQTTVDTRSEASTGVVAAKVITAAGWAITVGTVGPLSDRPPTQVLRDLARSDAMRWA